MSKLLPPPQLDTHIQTFPGIPPERKRQLADHLAALPVEHHAAVRQVLETPDDDPESHFIRGCFGEGGAIPEGSTPALRSHAAEDSTEHPGFPTAA